MLYTNRMENIHDKQRALGDATRSYGVFTVMVEERHKTRSKSFEALCLPSLGIASLVSKSASGDGGESWRHLPFIYLKGHER